MQQKKVLKEDLIRVLQGPCFAILEAKKDREKFQQYQKDKVVDFSKEELKDMKILEILQKLGYSINELGTYLYKDVISEIYNEIPKRKNSELIQELNNIYSSFYLYIASEWKEMGLKTFHAQIKKARERMNIPLIDNELKKRIYGENEKATYGIQAYQIAKYIAKEYSFNNTQKKPKEKIKKLANVSNM